MQLEKRFRILKERCHISEYKKVQWHNGLEPAWRIELGKESEKVTFEREHLLNSKPLQMDLLIIKKEEDVDIQKNIGRIFRKHNIIEYKSPDDYLSINDFYKVYGYACLYQSDTERVGEISAEEITLTFISNHYPKKMLRKLKKERNITVEEQGEGIYYLRGDFIPIQLLVNHQLSKEENYWLRSLRNDLKSGGEIGELVDKYETVKTEKWYEDLVDTILRGNRKELEAEKKMCDALRELFKDELEEARLQGEVCGEARGEVRGGAKAIVLDNLENGVSRNVIIEKLQRFLSIDEKTAEKYYEENSKA